MDHRQNDEYVFQIEDRNRIVMDDEDVAKYMGRQPTWDTLGYVTFKRTYARRLTDVQRSFRKNYGLRMSSISTEEFGESLRRVVEGDFSVLRQQVRMSGQRWVESEAKTKMRHMLDLMWRGLFLPPGRGLGNMGADVVEKKGAACLNNCGMVSTKNIDQDFATPFKMLMDYSMLGVGMGFDLEGAGKVLIRQPVQSLEAHVVADTREGWCDALERVLLAFVGIGSLPAAWDTTLVRPEGSIIHTFGGTASGPGPLEELLAGVANILFANVGRMITSTTIADVMNMEGRCVVAGNVRRSAEIALGLPTDLEFLALKDPTELGRLMGLQSARASEISEVCELQERIDQYQRSMEEWVLGTCVSRMSVLDPRAQEPLFQIARLKEWQKKLLKADGHWQELEAKVQAHPLRKYRWASNNTILCGMDQDYTDPAQQTATNGEPGYGWMDVIRNRGRLRDPENTLDAKAVGFNPCAEQTLWDKELCCLVETFPTKHRDLAEFRDTLKYAYLHAKIVTCIPTHNSSTNAVIARNRRIGTSMAGIWQMYETLGARECSRWWDEGYRHIRELDEDYSGWMGVGRSIKVTSVKPGGTIPLLVGVEGGMKLPISRFYMRTIRIESTSALAQALIDAGYRVEPDLTTPRTVVAYFPCKDATTQRVAREVSLWEQAALFTRLQADWSDNQVSATLTFQPHEAKDIAPVLAAYTGQWKAASFLPLWDHQYPQAPYIPCLEEEYEAALAKIRPLVLDEGDLHDTDEKFCTSDVCLLPGQ
jgi:hypothetical protein